MQRFTKKQLGIRNKVLSEMTHRGGSMKVSTTEKNLSPCFEGVCYATAKVIIAKMVAAGDIVMSQDRRGFVFIQTRGQ
ncbi:hypothetical protein N9137_00850 [Pseudomonadales bacterium]|nr:hypothetical protein [Pseudomonadales bacterium]